MVPLVLCRNWLKAIPRMPPMYPLCSNNSTPSPTSKCTSFRVRQQSSPDAMKVRNAVLFLALSTLPGSDRKSVEKANTTLFKYLHPKHFFFHVQACPFKPDSLGSQLVSDS